MKPLRSGSNVQARLAFPELVLEVDVRSARAFGSDIEALRDGVVGAIGIPTCEEPRAVTLLLSRVSEGDFYTRTSRHLRVLLSPEAVEHLLYKLNEITTAGGPSTPELGQFDAVDETGTPVLRRAQTLRVYLAAK